MILGTITSWTSGTGTKIRIDGEETATEKSYLWLAPYRPVVGDRVLIEEVGGQYVVLGKVTDNVNDSIVNGVRPYSGGSLIEFTVFNNNLWVKQNGTQWALARG